MKKIVLCAFMFFSSLHAAADSCFDGALTAGYVFKRDCLFKEVYGRGVIDVITADGCYYFREQWGVGGKVSYWYAKGRTTYLKACTRLQEIPLTFYLRRRTGCWCGWQAYASLGGGAIFIQEKSYLGRAKYTKGIGEFEVGADYFFCDCFDLTFAVRYLFPREKVCCQKADVGGFDLRAGIGFSY